jgi:6-pyruvoyltetrahydropterin/6-carboxytetrahydropterin synthase
MTVIRITKEFEFEAAHALEGYDGPCRNIHGHSYRLSVTVSGVPVADPDSPKKGMVMDFKDLKKIVKENIVDLFDHALVMPATLRNSSFQPAAEAFAKVIYTDYQPTSENMLIDFASRIRMELPDGVKLHSLVLRETSTSFSEWHLSDNP